MPGVVVGAGVHLLVAVPPVDGDDAGGGRARVSRQLRPPPGLGVPVLPRVLVRDVLLLLVLAVRNMHRHLNHKITIIMALLD